MNFILKYNQFKKTLLDNKKVIENYFFMTILQLLNSFFYFLIYPYLIRTLGSESYGVFVFATSVATYFSFFINFGFDYPAVKEASENVDNPNTLNKIISKVFTAKLYLLLASTCIFALLLFIFPLLQQHKTVFILCYLQILSAVFFPQWYFQAIQKMRIVTYIQLGCKIATLPFIFYLVNSPRDLEMYTLIVTIGTLIGVFVVTYIIYFIHQMRWSFVNFVDLKESFKDAIPFFLSNSAGIIKEQSITIIIGMYFGMRDVAIYDLANKIILLPRTLFFSVNGAIFPKLLQNISAVKVKKIIKIEALVASAVVILTIILAPFAIKILGGNEMYSAYPVTVFLSFTVLNWMVVGAFIAFIFVPQKKYYLASKNQLIALSSFAIYTIIGFLIEPSIVVFSIAIALSGITEIIYCIYITHKLRLLNNF